MASIVCHPGTEGIEPYTVWLWLCI